MRKQDSKLEWHIAESEAEWESLQALRQPAVAQTMTGHLPMKRYLWAVLFVLLAGFGEGWRRAPEASLQMAAMDECTTVQQTPLAIVPPSDDALVATKLNEQTNANWWHQYGWKYSGLRTPVEPVDLTASLDVVFQKVELLGNQAVARVVITAQNGASAYRQMRFYRHTTTGWQQTMPDATLGGMERSLETPHFVFHFLEKDAGVVHAVALQMDALYSTFGLPISPTSGKLAVNVSVEM